MAAAKWATQLGVAVAAAATIIGAATAQISSEVPPAGRDEIIVTAPGLSGSADLDTIDAKAIRAAGTPELLNAIARSIPGLSLQDAQSNPYQPSLIYHGYTASSLQGTAQGLAFYIDGARFNQPFGDTINFDLLPEQAIETVDIENANPVYGLNALGGVITISTRTGHGFQGVEISGAGGDHGRREGAVEAGWEHGRASAYLAFEAAHDDGWRRHSPSTLYRGYADIGDDGERAGIHFKLIGVDSDLTGNGSAPVQLLAADRRAVFTYPDTTRNRFARVSLHPWFDLSDRTRILGSLYVQELRQGTVNGDAADIERCDEDASLLCLANTSDEASPLINTSGRQVAALLGRGNPYGVLNRSRTRSESGGALVQLVDHRPLLGGENRLAIGLSYDRSGTAFHSSTELGALTEQRSVDPLDETIAQPDGSITPVSLVAHTRYTGLFLSESLPMGPRFSADLGLRYNIAKILLSDRIGTDLNGQHRFTRLNLGGSIAYRFSEALNLTAGYSEANRAPTPAELSCAGPNAPCSFANFFVGDPPLKQVVAKSWQGGASGRLDVSGWRVEWALSAYRATNHNDIEFIASDVRGRALFQNVGRTRRQGIDTSVSAKRGHWVARLGYAFIDATFRDPLTLNSPDNPAPSDNGTIRVNRGDRLPGIPRHRGVVSIDYEYKRWSAGADLQAQSGQYLVGDEANLQPKTKGFIVMDLRASKMLFAGCSIFAEISNLFDRRYATFGTFSETANVFLAEAPVPQIREASDQGRRAAGSWA